MTNDLAGHVQAEVSRAEQDYQNFRGRALSLIGVSGGLVALVSGLLAIAAGSTHPVLPVSARWSLAIALVAFVVSTVLALLINLPGLVTATDVADLRSKVADHWDDEGWDQQVASILVDYLSDLRGNNASNAKLLMASIAFQILGIAGVAATALLILTKA